MAGTFVPLNRTEMRYRVVELLDMTSIPWDDIRPGHDYVTITARRSKEYLTYEGANACRKRWEAEGGHVLVQEGHITWLTEEEARTLVGEGWTEERFGGVVPHGQMTERRLYVTREPAYRAAVEIVEQTLAGDASDLAQRIRKALEDGQPHLPADEQGEIEPGREG